jgi:hypothetical protein
MRRLLDERLGTPTGAEIKFEIDDGCEDWRLNLVLKTITKWNKCSDRAWCAGYCDRKTSCWYFSDGIDVYYKENMHCGVDCEERCDSCTRRML